MRNESIPSHSEKNVANNDANVVGSNGKEKSQHGRSAALDGAQSWATRTAGMPTSGSAHQHYRCWKLLFNYKIHLAFSMMHYLIFTYRHAAVYDFARTIDDNLEYIKAVEYIGSKFKAF